MTPTKEQIKSVHNLFAQWLFANKRIGTDDSGIELIAEIDQQAQAEAYERAAVLVDAADLDEGSRVRHLIEDIRALAKPVGETT